jgi:hypothetical protein
VWQLLPLSSKQAELLKNETPPFIKTTGPDRITTKEYENIQVLDPDPQLFEIPQDYKIVDKKQFIPPSFSHP